MKRKGWYMVAYDICDQRRLMRIHRRMKKMGIAAQKSVFFVQGNEDQIEKILDRLAEYMDLRADDLRAYPIEHPARVWTLGENPLAAAPLVQVGGGKGPKITRFLRSIWRK